MVFESIVADLLNRFLGDYVENLDHSQLKIGIWGGDVVLQDLVLKQSALDDLNLPVKTVYGTLGKLVLKIPWKNLYSAPVEATIEGLFLLVVPNQEVKYDPIKEEKWSQEAKQAELTKIEEAKKREKEKDKPKPDDTFVEKLATQIIKNVQVKISNIHVRFEDKVTKPEQPFSLGITLHNLSVHTTDENWKACVVQDAATMIYKVLNLEGLALYWNPQSMFFSGREATDMKDMFKKGICTKQEQPKDYKYMLGPINSSAQLRLNPKPEYDGSNYTIPKAQLSLNMEKLSIGISRFQYHDLIDLLESFERMSVGAPYRKYRPFVSSYRGHYKAWWHFAYTCILEETVRRRRRNWNWEHMAQFRRVCRSYAENYQIKLTTRKLPSDVQVTLDNCEKILDVMNIVLIRQKIEMDVERMDRKEQELKKQKSSSGWFSGWFGGSTQTKEEEALTAAAIAKKFEDAMTPDEKAKLYRAIDYQENMKPTQYPKTFVEVRLSFMLNCLALEVRDDSLQIPQVISVELKSVSSCVEQRPSADALKLTVQIADLTVFGLKQDARLPKLVTSKEHDSKALLDVLFEKNPLDESCDQRIHVGSKSLEVVYDAETINKVVDVFKAPKPVNLSQLQAAAGSTLADFKEMSATGLQHAIQQQNIMDLKVDLEASYIVLPHGGIYLGDENLLVVNLGSVKITSLPRDRTSPNIRALHSQGTTEEEIMKTMMSQSYDRFRLNLEQMQILIALKTENWQDVLTSNQVTPMHLLQPTNLTIQLDKCLFTDDPRLPKLKINGSLPNVAVNITDDRLLTLLALFTSIPFPSDEEAQAQPLQESASRSSSMSMVNKLLDLPTDKNKVKLTPTTPQPPSQDTELVQFTELEVNFQMGDFKISISQASENEKLLDFNLLRLEVEMVQKTFDMTVMLRIGGISLIHYDPVASVCLLDTPMAAGDSKYLFTVLYVDVNKQSPEFHTKHGSVLKLVDVKFTTLDVLLHQESLLTLLAVSNNFQSRLEEIQGKPETGDRIVVQPSPTTLPTRMPLSVIPEEESVTVDETKVVPKKRRKKSIQEIDLKIAAYLEHFKVEIGNRKSKIAVVLVQGAVAGVIVKKTNTVITAKLKDFVIHDPNPETIHPNIISIMGQEAMSAQIVMYNEEEQDDSIVEKVDMSVQASMACLRIVFLNWFVSNLLKFLNSFQQAQKAIVDAAAGAAEAAKQNMQEAYEKAAKLSLDIKLQAPIIVIPVNSKSNDTLILDFGNLTLYNKFKTLNVRSLKGHPAVVDELNLDLQNLKLSRAKLDDEAKEVVNESLILQPITFGLLVLRNLSAGWYKEIPDLDLSGRLESINVTLSQEDYRKVMQVLQENFAEGAAQEPTTPESGEQEVNLAEQRKSLERPSTLEGVRSISLDASVEEKEKGADSAPVYTSIKFTFTMESLIIDLFTGGSKDLHGVSSPLHLPENGLGRFSLHILSLKGRILSDSSIITSILLVDCLLDDTRFNSDSKIKRLMERKSEAPSNASPAVEAPFRSMIDLTYQQKGSEMFVDLRIYGFTLTVCLSYLMKVADFFTSGLEPPTPPVEETTGKTASAQQNQLTVKPSKSKPSISKSKSATTTSVAPQQTSSSMMTVNIRVEKPDIILVENMDDLDTNAIILNNEITFKLRMTDSHKVMNGSLKDLQLYSCCFNPAKRKETMAQILHPCSISLAGSTPEGQGLHLDICTTDIRLRVSPATIGLLSNVQGQLAVSADEAEDGEKEVDYADIWTPKKFEDSEYWFLKTEVGEDAVLTTETTLEPAPPTGELCIVTAPSVVITMEAGVGSQTLPMILAEIGFQGSIVDWSTQMSLSSCLALQVAYYNSQLALWEPLIEPVEQVKDGRLLHCPWELRADIHMNSQEPIASPMSQTASDIEDIPYVPPAMSIEISSKENLELTMTKTCLDVLTNLGKAFQSAMLEGPKKPKPVSPYLVQNDTGLIITIVLNKGPFQVQDSNDGDRVKQVVLQSGAKVGLCLEEPEELKITILAGTPTEKNKVTEKFLTIRIGEMRDCELELPVVRADKRYFSLNHRGDSKDTWGLVSDVTVQDGGTIVTLRSIIQVLNHFSEPIDVYYMTRRGNEVECIGTVESGDRLNLPLYSIYTLTNELFFSVKEYTVSVIPFVWKDLQNQLTTTKLLQCDPKNKNDMEPFFMKIVGEMEQVYFEKTNRHTMSSTCYNIHLRPAVILKNFLPVDLICCIQGIPTEKKIKAGESIQMPTAEPGNTVIVLRIVDYLEKEWSCKHEIQLHAPEFAVWTFDSYDSVQKVSLDLGMNTLSKRGSIVMSLYCPFWMLNKTGVMLTYRKSRKVERTETSGSPIKQFEEAANVIYHPEDFKGPILFSFRAKSFFGKKKASIKVEDGEWSDKFSLDVAGSSGVVSCTTGDTIYQIGVHIQLTHSTLTKQVIFMPYYVLVNNASYIIECQEADRPADPWIKVKPGECNPFWPRSKDQKKEMRVRIQDTSEMSAPFSYSAGHTTMLKLYNKHGGVNVDVQMTEGAVYVTFSPYNPGMAPALILNHTSDTLSLWEKGSNVIITLQPREKLLYAWEKPTGSRCIVWNAGKKKELTDELRKDGIGEFHPTEGQQMWWVSFLDGMQRVLLFTLDMNIARDAQSAGELETLDKEITVSIHGLGLSLVNNLTHVEVMYIGIASSGIIWETCKSNKQRFKPLSVKDCQAIEEAFVRYNMELSVGKTVSSKVVIDPKTEVDFETEEMLRPSKRRLRRTFQTGLWLQMKTSPHQVQLHAKVNRLQIDNQMYDSVFPVVLAPVPPPKSVAADSALKPFAELSIVQRIMPHSTVQQYKYFKILIQEFHVKVDMGFINGLLEMFQSEEVSDTEEMRLFEEDRQLVEKPLLSHVTLVSTQEQKNFYDLLHFSPLKIHLSFSLSGGAGPKAPGQETPRFMNVLLQSLGVTLTDVQDVVFKLAYFERQYTFLTQQQLISEVTMHYVGQSVKQLYVLVLGLDVIGNPYGLVLGFTQGVEDLFYEPFQGAIQGPGEFAEGLVLGVRSLFGHTVGGAAGAVSRITGAMGKGIAALTFDKDYQRKRREAMNQRPANVQMGLAQSGKGLVMGVVDGVSGVILKPISGAKQEGVEGFFKGVGKGVMGLVTRPTAGVIDFASGSFDAVKRATEMSDEVTRLRPPRFFQQDGLVRPYVRMEADGNKLLQELDKGRYATTDIYVHHMSIAPGSRDTLMLTDKRVMYIVHNDIFGGWQVDWDYTWDSLSAPPRIVEKGIFISTGEHKKKVLGLFGHGESGKVILIQGQEQKEWLVNKMMELMKV
ncbi:intermembrane lipid transfer protein Vps13 isoform X2 [Periplaneta americana]|uniref:intermembrane lipid transfer protein Vps13 isoform X2 n=1 Tax=Periplaneta americana TaxID=6978 RepID=UPI0037E90205